MKKALLVITTLILLSACSGTKKTQNAIDNGDYDGAFNNAVAKLNKDKNKYEKQVPLLKNAFEKATAKDLAEIKRLENQKSKNVKAIYNKYMNVDVRQDEIILLKPLYFEGKEVDFPIKNYSQKIKKARKNYADKLYNEALPLLNNSKANSRKAFAILEDLQYVDPNYNSNLGSLINSAKKRGSDYVFVTLQNNVAKKLTDSSSLAALKDFTKIRSGDFNNEWVVIHNKRDQSVTYDYNVKIYLDNLTAIPFKEELDEIKQIKEVQTGWIIQKDKDGNPLKDENGNVIKKPEIKKVRAELTIYKQSQATTLTGKVEIKKVNTTQQAIQKAITAEAKLENIYGSYTGDPKAIDEKYYKALKNKKQTFPPNDKFNEFTLKSFKMQVEQFLSVYKY